jgi:peptidoglycan/xylan/chitin deacetylase (PgdA/CDA1 family)
LNALVKEGVLRAACGCGVTALARLSRGRCARILAYHGVDPAAGRADNFDGFHVAPAVFERHLQMLTRRFRIVSLREIVRVLSEGRKPSAESVVITFDDGYANNLAVAAPLLAKYGCHATFFVTTGFIDGTVTPWWYAVRQATGNPRRAIALEAEIKDLPLASREQRLIDLDAADAKTPYPFMTWPDVSALVTQGFDIGAHTVHHAALGREDAGTVSREIVGSFARIRQMVRGTVDFFAYPYGRPEDASPAAIEALQREGCAAAVTTSHGRARPGADLLRLPRFNVTGRHTAAALEMLVS